MTTNDWPAILIPGMAGNDDFRSAGLPMLRFVKVFRGPVEPPC
jgi:hypothetical protein